jgi:MFS family permease
MICALLAVVVAMVLLGAALVLIAALVLLAVMGIGRTVLDVSGRMLLQRAAPQDAVASVFATLEAMTLAGTALGAVVVQVVIAASGVRAAVFTLAATLGLLLLATVRSLRRVDDIADAPVMAIRLLKSAAIFASLPPIEIEGVARAGSIEHVEAGSTIIYEGERGDRYYVVAGGTVDVFIDGVFVRTMGRTEGFGEIALLADAPRTATVIAASDAEVFFIDRVPFLRVVTGHDSSRHTAWSVARAYGATALEQEWC